MLNSVMIARRQSEIRQQLAALVGNPAASADEVRALETLDAEYRVEKNGSGIVIECTKMKDAPEPKPLHFELASVTLGEGQDGKPITSAVLRPSGDFSSNVVKKMTAMQLLAINAYDAAVLAAGTLDADGAFVGLHVEQWREEFYRRHTGDSLGTKRKAFNRAREDMIEIRRFKVDNDIYSPAGDFACIDATRYAEIIKKRDTGQ